MYRIILAALICSCLAGRPSRASVTLAVHGGNPDGFAAPYEQTSPSINLIVHNPFGAGTYYYDPIPGVTAGFPTDRVLLDTLELPAGEIVGGTISMRARAGLGNVANDAFILGFADGSGFVEKYSRNFGNANGVSGLTGETWDSGDEALIVLDLGSLPIAPQLGGGSVSVLADMNARRFIDFIVQDETGVDFVKLELNVVPPPSTQGDFNDDGIVDGQDFVHWRNSLGDLVDPYYGADANGNGVVDNVDYEIWRSNFGSNPTNSGDGSPITSVPEPASLLLLFAGVGGIALRRFRSELA